MGNTKSFRIDSCVKLGFIVLLAAQVIFAQMGGGMMGPGSSGSGMSGNGPGQQGGSMGPGGMSGQMMGPGMGGGMMDGPAVGPDGTAYVVRRADTPATSGQMMPQGQSQIRHELVAISPVDGKPRWTLGIQAARISEPAVARDGKIFLTVDDTPMGMQGQPGGMMNPGTQTTPNKAKLITVIAGPNSAQIQNTVEVDSDVLSAPKIAITDTAGNYYVIYAYGMEMAGMGSRNTDDRDSIPAGERDLYAFGPDGRLKFRVKLGQAQAGIPPR
ncbi:MAG: hypothetical protein Q8N47_16425 [Bryobacterales bacterium]|nr:hypothetical protein [Bryobacterales bacterium]